MSDPTHTPRALAVALVAMSKAMSSIVPAYGQSLQDVLKGAEGAGISDDDLSILRMLIRSARTGAVEKPKDKATRT